MSDVQYFSLDGWTLTLMPATHSDWSHPSLLFRIVSRSNQDQYGLTLNSVIQPNTVLLRSAIVAMVNGKGGARAAEALAGLMFQEGCFNPNHPNYRADLLDHMIKLTPRREITTQKDGMLLFNEKMLHNVFGTKGSTMLLKAGTFVNHSCAPNTLIDWDFLVREARFVSLRVINANEEMTINYDIWPIDCKEIRKERLSQHGIDECHCEWCLQNINPSFALVVCRVAIEHCVWCGKKTKSQCQGCQIARFCSVECQRLDWPFHKQICKTIANK